MIVHEKRQHSCSSCAFFERRGSYRDGFCMKGVGTGRLPTDGVFVHDDYGCRLHTGLYRDRIRAMQDAIFDVVPAAIEAAVATGNQQLSAKLRALEVLAAGEVE